MSLAGTRPLSRAVGRPSYRDAETLTHLSRRADPFRSAEEAWFWTSAMLQARRDNVVVAERAGGRAPVCDPDEVLRCIDQLYRRRRIELGHARVLRAWGVAQRAPDPAVPAEEADWKMWREAIDSLEWALRVRGIVSAGPVAGGPA